MADLYPDLNIIGLDLLNSIDQLNHRSDIYKAFNSDSKFVIYQMMDMRLMGNSYFFEWKNAGYKDINGRVSISLFIPKGLSQYDYVHYKCRVFQRNA